MKIKQAAVDEKKRQEALAQEQLEQEKLAAKAAQ